MTDTPTYQQTRSALQLIYMICFGVQAALSIILALILALLSRTLSTPTSSTDLITQQLSQTSSSQTSNISLMMLFVVMLFLLPSALLVASLWQRRYRQSSQYSHTPHMQKETKVASIASTIALAVILAISVWVCVFAYFIDIIPQALFALVASSIGLYFVGFMATGFYAKNAHTVRSKR